MNTFIYPDWPAPNKIKAVTTTKPFDVGFRENSDINQAIKNRQQLQQQFNLENPPIWLTQVHGTHVVQAECCDEKPIADASFTRKTNTVCVVMTADCLPILICDKDGREVAAIHGGWRSLAAGIIDQTIQHLTSNPKDLLVWFGPAIGPNHFEVGLEVLEAFVKYDQKTEKAFKLTGNNKAMADIYEIARIQLLKLGVDKCYGGEYCTVSDADRFYSYRREKGLRGNLASLIWIED